MSNDTREERTGKNSPERPRRHQISTRLSPTTRLLAPEAVGLPRPSRRNLGREQSPGGKRRHPPIHSASGTQLSHRPARRDGGIL